MSYDQIERGGSREYATRLEQRLLAIVTSIALFFGGWWLQNQYTMTLKLQEQFAENIRFVDEKYVQKDYLATLTERLNRIERKIDDLKEDQHPDPEEPRRPVSRSGGTR